MFWQLSGGVRTTVAADVYDVDALDTPSATLGALRREGRRVVCYVSAGSWERGRPDAGDFPARLLGKQLDGWPDERWLDVRALAVLQPILRERITGCAHKGFDGIEFDNVDGYANDTGFPIAPSDQLRFNRWLADEAHRHGLAAVLKNDDDQVQDLVRWFDASLVEQCFEFDECEAYLPFVRAGKPVWVAEYSLDPDEFCPAARELGVQATRYPLELDGAATLCR